MVWVPSRSRWRRTSTRAGAGRPAGLLGQLQGHAIEAHDVIVSDDALLFLADDLLEIDVAEGNEGRRGIGRGAGEGGVVVGDEVLDEVRVGRVHGGDAGVAQFIDQPILEGAIEPLAAAAGLRGVGADVFDAQAGEGAAELGEVSAIHGPPALGVMKAQPARSVYRVWGNPRVRSTWASALMTACRVSAGQS
jgi:hypothetical protein